MKRQNRPFHENYKKNSIYRSNPANVSTRRVCRTKRGSTTAFSLSHWQMHLDLALIQRLSSGPGVYWMRLMTRGRLRKYEKHWLTGDDKYSKASYSYVKP